MDLLWSVLWCTILVSIVVFPSTVHSDPIMVSFDNCQPATYPVGTGANASTVTLQCCPTQPTMPIIDGLPPPTTSYIRTRNAIQCTDETYAQKLNRAYELMRALPDDDPRSFTQQWYTHCSYCGGAFLMPDGTTGIDIHFSWLFLPWHRYFVYFHERILQSLLGDTSFSLSYWNWDNPFTVGDGTNSDGACLVAGDNFPPVYASSSSVLYDDNRSANAMGQGRLDFPDLTFSAILPAAQQPLYNASADVVIASNLNVMNLAMVTAGSTIGAFQGKPYRAGDSRGNPTATGGAGTLEATAHASVHAWTGRDPPVNIDMGTLYYAARDPVFWQHHSNIDRLFSVWKAIGPSLWQDREYSTDPDYLNASFLFYDENKDLRRVKVADCLDTEKLGYVFQEANDAAWIDITPFKCSTTHRTDLIAQAQKLATPTKDSEGYYNLQAGTPFIIVIDYPANANPTQQFLSLTGIKLNRALNAGFDVFIDMPYPRSYANPWSCAEYAGRFMNMAQSQNTLNPNQEMMWSASISRVMVDIQSPPSQLVVTILPLSGKAGIETIRFTTIAIGDSS